MRWPLALAIGLTLTSGLAGCRGNRECREAVELELRAREDDVRQLRSELDRAEFYNQALARELAAHRKIPGPLGVVEKPTEPYPVRTIRLGRGTAGRPASCGGDDALQVQVEVVDCEESVIKAPGCLYLEVLEINNEGLKRPLSTWEIPREQLRHKWQSGLFNSGYVLTLPWKVFPSTEKLRVLARFTLIDGRMFEADKDITIRLMPEHLRRIAPTLPDPTPSPAADPVPKSALPAPTEDPMPPSMMDEIPPPPSPPAGVMPIPTTPSNATPSSIDGPLLTKGRKGPVKVQLLRPVPMPTDED